MSPKVALRRAAGASRFTGGIKTASKDFVSRAKKAQSEQRELSGELNRINDARRAVGLAPMSGREFMENRQWAERMAEGRLALDRSEMVRNVHFAKTLNYEAAKKLKEVLSAGLPKITPKGTLVINILAEEMVKKLGAQLIIGFDSNSLFQLLFKSEKYRQLIGALSRGENLAGVREEAIEEVGALLQQAQEEQ